MSLRDQIVSLYLLNPAPNTHLQSMMEEIVHSDTSYESQNRQSRFAMELANMVFQTVTGTETKVADDTPCVHHSDLRKNVLNAYFLAKREDVSELVRIYNRADLESERDKPAHSSIRFIFSRLTQLYTLFWTPKEAEMFWAPRKPESEERAD